MCDVRKILLVSVFLFTLFTGCVWVEKRDWMGKDLDDLVLTYGRADYITYEDNDNGVYEKKRYIYRFDSERTLSGRTYSTDRLINEVPVAVSSHTYGKPRTRHTVEWRSYYVDSEDKIYDVKGGLTVIDNLKSSSVPDTPNQLFNSKQFDAMSQNQKDAELDRLLKKSVKVDKDQKNVLERVKK